MGCLQTKEELLHQTENNKSLCDLIAEGEGAILNLNKGGIVIKTALGPIQYGILPETVKDSMSMGLSIPEYYIIPTKKFDWNDGINLMEFEFPVYFNFFIKKRMKTKLICDAVTRQQIEIIFQETLLGPQSYEGFELEFAEGYKGRPDIVKELAFFAKNPFNPSQKLSTDIFIEFIIYDNKNQVTINHEKDGKACEVKIIKKEDSYLVYENGKYLTSFEDEVKIVQDNYFIYKTLSNENTEKFEPPVFGFTALGTSHGFDCHGSTSGFIIWLNRKGIMVDPPPYSSRALRSQGIPPNVIEKIVITHCHADHDAGAFHKIIEAAPVEFISTTTIIQSFLRKHSAISGVSVEELASLFNFRTILIGHPTFIMGARFTFHYSFHSIPALCFEINYLDKSFFFSGDTFYNPQRLEELHKEGLFSKERFEHLAHRDFNKYDLIFHEAGIPPIHTPTSILSQLPEEVRKKLFLIHIAEKDIPKDNLLKGITPGLQQTIELYKNHPDEDSTQNNLDLLCSIELINWVPFNRITEILQCFKEISFKTNELIIMEKTFGNHFYIVKSGIVKIYSNNDDNKFSKLIYRGDYFGESAIIGDGFRLANVEGFTDGSLLEIHKSDFIWIFTFPEAKGSRLSPMVMMKNLSLLRKAKEAEFINLNTTISKMTENQKCMINMFIKEENFKKDELIWKKGDRVEFCIMVKSGKFQMKAPFWKVPKNFYLAPGTLLGDFPNLIKNEPCLSSLKCIQDGTAFKLSKKDFLEFLYHFPGFYIMIRDKYVIY